MENIDNTLLVTLIILFFYYGIYLGFPDKVSKGSKKKWKCISKCALRGPADPCTGYISGTGYGKTESKACKTAKKDADVPQGCTKGHCQCKCK